MLTIAEKPETHPDLSVTSCGFDIFLDENISKTTILLLKTGL